MSIIRQVLELKYQNALTTRQIQTITQVSKSSVANYLKTYKELDVSLDEVLALNDKTLEELFFPRHRETAKTVTTKYDVSFHHSEEWSFYTQYVDLSRCGLVLKRDTLLFIPCTS